MNSIDLNESVITTNTSEIYVTSDALNIPYVTCELLVAVIAIVGNALVIIVFINERRLRRRTNYYIVSLAVADFLVGILGIPFAILASIGLPTNLYACLFTVSLLVVLCTTSIFCLVAVSVDRYWAILYPLAYSKNVSTKTAIVIISFCWILGCIIGFIPLFGWYSKYEEGHCLFVEIMDYDYLVFLYFTTIITPSILLLAFYAHIYTVIIKQVRQIVTINPSETNIKSSSVVLRRNNNGSGVTMLRIFGDARKREVKATQNLSIIVLFFIICWMPLYTINCINAFCEICIDNPTITYYCIILSHLNSAVNPFLYAYHLKDFRYSLKIYIMKIFRKKISETDNNYRFSLTNQLRIQPGGVVNRLPSISSKVYGNLSIVREQKEIFKRNSTTVLSNVKDISPEIERKIDFTDNDMNLSSEIPITEDNCTTWHNIRNNLENKTQSITNTDDTETVSLKSTHAWKSNEHKVQDVKYDNAFIELHSIKDSSHIIQKPFTIYVDAQNLQTNLSGTNYTYPTDPLPSKIFEIVSESISPENYTYL